MPDLVIKSSGYSITLTDFSKRHKEWVRRQKQSIDTAIQRWLGVWAREVQVRTRHNTPEFDGGGFNPNSLTNSIVVTTPVAQGKRYKIQVGVSSDWSSNYEEWFAGTYGKLPPWGIARPYLAWFLHEFWSDVAGERAQRAAARKGSKYNSVVGERFLYRGTREASDPRGLAVMAKRVFSSAIGDYRPRGTKFKGTDLQPERTEL